MKRLPLLFLLAASLAGCEKIEIESHYSKFRVFTAPIHHLEKHFDSVQINTEGDKGMIAFYDGLNVVGVYPISEKNINDQN